MPIDITLSVNGDDYSVTTDPDRSLLDVLREDLGLTGAKYGCGEGACGSCTVLLDGKPIRSCITRARDAVGGTITTIEGLADGDRLDPVQEAFAEEGVLQCGYCAPGLILATVALLRETPRPTDRQITRALNGHICRCCTYPTILAAVRKAAGLEVA